MDLIEFKSLPDTSTPVNASNLNHNFSELNNGIDELKTDVNDSKNWKKVSFDESNNTFTVPISWENLTEISFRVLGTDQASFSYVTIPKGQWHNDGSYPVQVVCFSTGGGNTGYANFIVISKNVDNFIVKMVAGSTSGVSLFYR